MKIITDVEMLSDLKVGDTVIGKSFARPYIVTAHYGDRVTAVMSIDITNPNEWTVMRDAKSINIEE